MYEGNLNVDELMEWISAMDKYFKYENVPDEKKLKFFMKRMKGHAFLWWDGVQAEKQGKNQKLGQNGNNVERKVHSHRFLA